MHCVRFVAISVHELIHDALEALTQGLEEHRHEAGDYKRDQGGTLRPEHRAQISHDQHIKGNAARAQGAVKTRVRRFLREQFPMFGNGATCLP